MIDGTTGIVVAVAICTSMKCEQKVDAPLHQPIAHVHTCSQYGCNSEK